MQAAGCAALLALFVAFLPVPLWAASEKEKAIYVVDMQRVLDESIAGKAARNNMKDEVKKRESKLLVARNELAKLSADLEKQSALLSEEALREKREQLARRERDFERQVQDQREELARKNDEEISRVVRDAQAAIADLAKKQGLPFILERGDGFVIYVKDEYDITGQVISELDKKSLG
jgi:outer membrane protein